ncbi:MAG: ATP-binding protein [bacterium]|nr:ATP-binding protein [bacterium]
MVLLAGPRQCGKTTLAKKLLGAEKPNGPTRYFNWDSLRDRDLILEERFPTGPGLLVLDEIHKYSRWRQVVKGLFDKRGDEISILVTGSAKLDHYRHGGDSLQGRYHFHRLHPLTYAELGASSPSDLKDLLTLGGFPEPFLSGSEKQARRWSRDYRSRLVIEDLQDLEQVKDIALVQQLVLRLPQLVSAPLSINSLREDLQVAHQTVARWLNILENLYMIFRIYPFGAPSIKAVKKEAKHYHLDWTVVKNLGARLENLVACHILKWCHFLEDTEGRDVELRYYRDTTGREVDFVVLEENNPIMFIECKSSPGKRHRGLSYLKEKYPDVQAVQIDTQTTSDTLSNKGIRYVSVGGFLGELV